MSLLNLFSKSSYSTCSGARRGCSTPSPPILQRACCKVPTPLHPGSCRAALLESAPSPVPAPPPPAVQAPPPPPKPPAAAQPSVAQAPAQPRPPSAPSRRERPACGEGARDVQPPLHLRGDSRMTVSGDGEHARLSPPPRALTCRAASPAAPGRRRAVLQFLRGGLKPASVPPPQEARPPPPAATRSGSSSPARSYGASGVPSSRRVRTGHQALE